jgi:hypothetical protein
MNSKGDRGIKVKELCGSEGRFRNHVIKKTLIAKV